MADEKHVPGTMNIDAQEKAFAGFAIMVARAIVVIVVALILLYIING